MIGAGLAPVARAPGRRACRWASAATARPPPTRPRSGWRAATRCCSVGCAAAPRPCRPATRSTWPPAAAPGASAVTARSVSCRSARWATSRCGASTASASPGAVSDPIEAWLRCGPTSPRHTIVAGRFVVEDGALVSPDARRHPPPPPRRRHPSPGPRLTPRFLSGLPPAGHVVSVATLGSDHHRSFAGRSRLREACTRRCAGPRPSWRTLDREPLAVDPLRQRTAVHGLASRSQLVADRRQPPARVRVRPSSEADTSTVPVTSATWARRAGALPVCPLGPPCPGVSRTATGARAGVRVGALGCTGERRRTAQSIAGVTGHRRLEPLRRRTITLRSPNGTPVTVGYAPSSARSGRGARRVAEVGLDDRSARSSDDRRATGDRRAVRPGTPAGRASLEPWATR